METDKLKEYEFVEIKKNRFGRRWGIKRNGKIIQMGYNFVLGKELFKRLTEQAVKEAANENN